MIRHCSCLNISMKASVEQVYPSTRRTKSTCLSHCMGIHTTWSIDQRSLILLPAHSSEARPGKDAGFRGSRLDSTQSLEALEFVSLRRRALRDCVKFINFAFWIKCHLVFNFYSIVILSCDPCVFSINCQLSRSNARARSVCFQYKLLVISQQRTSTLPSTTKSYYTSQAQIL